MKKISIIIPVLNEEKYIESLVKSLLSQTIDFDSAECIFVDGGSTDATILKLKEYCNKYPQFFIFLHNPNKTAPFALNIGIKASRGDYIIRLDAHSEYPNNYIEKCIYFLENTDADNVGGIAITKSTGFVGEVIAKMLSSKFGVGNSEFRTNGQSGYVDTVPFGAFRRSTFEKYGLFDERLTRNQDNEMNYRIRKNGGKIFMSDEIKLTYYCRNTVGGISKMAINNGKWNIITMKLCPGSMGIRHFVPFLFLTSIIGLITISSIYSPFLWLLFAEVVLYACLDLFFTYKTKSNIVQSVLLFFLFPTFHFAYGLGSLIGIFESKNFKQIIA